MDTPYTHVLIPGRHHLITRYLEEYFQALVRGTHLFTAKDGGAVDATGATLVWAITSADHATTRRNPIPFARRVQMIERSKVGSRAADAASLLFGIDDVPPTPRYPTHVLQEIVAQQGPVLTPEATLLATSTPEVATQYERLGYRILLIEIDPDPPAAAASVPRLRPADLLEPIGLAGVVRPALADVLADATRSVIAEYGLTTRLQEIYADPLGGDEGELTETRNYRTYAEAFDVSATRKWQELAPHVEPGRIVDIGCGAGALLEQAAKTPALQDSDLYGVEAARPLYEECLHRRRQGVFKNPNTFFHRRNILSTPIFPEGSVDTTLTVALTHEIASYLGLDALEELLRRIYAHTRPGGVWLNLDVCGPADGDQQVDFRFHPSPAHTALVHETPTLELIPQDFTGRAPAEVEAALAALPPFARFVQFAHDWRPDHAGIGTDNWTARLEHGDPAQITVTAPLRLVMEWLAKDSYTDNWLSEMHEAFCFWDAAAYQAAAAAAGFELAVGTRAWTNRWLVEQRFGPLGTLSVPWPDTHLLLVARRPLDR